MHPQIQEIIDDCDAAQQRLRALAKRVPDDRWGERGPGGGWSPSECIEHLNMTSESFLPRLRIAVAEARKLGTTAPDRMRRKGFFGWMLWKVMPPPVSRMKAKTTPDFIPHTHLTPAQIRERFDTLQAELVQMLREADGLPIDRVRIVSPFGEKIKYNAFAAFGIIPRHQHRHIWQAEQARMF